MEEVPERGRNVSAWVKERRVRERTEEGEERGKKFREEVRSVGTGEKSQDKNSWCQGGLKELLKNRNV